MVYSIKRSSESANALAGGNGGTAVAFTAAKRQSERFTETQAKIIEALAKGAKWMPIKMLGNCTGMASGAGISSLYTAAKRLIEQGVLCEMRFDHLAACYYFSESFARESGYGVRGKDCAAEDFVAGGGETRENHAHHLLIHLDREKDAGRKIDWDKICETPRHALGLAQLGGPYKALVKLDERNHLFRCSDDGPLIRAVQLGGIETSMIGGDGLVESKLLFKSKNDVKSLQEAFEKHGMELKMSRSDIYDLGNLKEGEKMTLSCNGKFYFARLRKSTLRVYDIVEANNAENALRGLLLRYLPLIEGIAHSTLAKWKICVRSPDCYSRPNAKANALLQSDVKAAAERAIFEAALEIDPTKASEKAESLEQDDWSGFFVNIAKLRLIDILRDLAHEANPTGSFLSPRQIATLWDVRQETLSHGEEEGNVEKTESQGKVVDPVEKAAKEAGISADRARKLLVFENVVSLDSQVRGDKDDGPLDLREAIDAAEQMKGFAAFERGMGTPALVRPDEAVEEEDLAAFIQNLRKSGGVPKGHDAAVLGMKGVLVLARTSTALDRQELQVLDLHYGLDGSAGITLNEIGEKLGFSESRACQIETKAMKKIRVAAAKLAGEGAAGGNGHRPIGIDIAGAKPARAGTSAQVRKLAESFRRDMRMNETLEGNGKLEFDAAKAAERVDGFWKEVRGQIEASAEAGHARAALEMLGATEGNPVIELGSSVRSMNGSAVPSLNVAQVAMGKKGKRIVASMQTIGEAAFNERMFGSAVSVMGWNHLNAQGREFLFECANAALKKGGKFAIVSESLPVFEFERFGFRFAEEKALGNDACISVFEKTADVFVRERPSLGGMDAVEKLRIMKMCGRNLNPNVGDGWRNSMPAAREPAAESIE